MGPTTQEQYTAGFDFFEADEDASTLDDLDQVLTDGDDGTDPIVNVMRAIIARRRRKPRPMPRPPMSRAPRCFARARAPRSRRVAASIARASPAAEPPSEPPSPSLADGVRRLGGETAVICLIAERSGFAAVQRVVVNVCAARPRARGPPLRRTAPRMRERPGWHRGVAVTNTDLEPTGRT
jgi:hypothetical protein